MTTKVKSKKCDVTSTQSVTVGFEDEVSVPNNVGGLKKLEKKTRILPENRQKECRPAYTLISEVSVGLLNYRTIR